MQNERLDSIIRIRSSLKFKGACCKDFCVRNEKIELFNSKSLYHKQEESQETAEYENLINISQLL